MLNYPNSNLIFFFDDKVFIHCFPYGNMKMFNIKLTYDFLMIKSIFISLFNTGRCISEI